VAAAGVAAAIDRPGTVRHAVRLIRKLLAITRVLMAYVISVKRTENIDIYYKDWGSGRPVVNGNSAGRRKNVFSS
jgi:hypothetical protein